MELHWQCWVEVYGLITGRACSAALHAQHAWHTPGSSSFRLVMTNGLLILQANDVKS
jgi:hypothetical protein